MYPWYRFIWKYFLGLKNNSTKEISILFLKRVYNNYDSFI